MNLSNDNLHDTQALWSLSDGVDFENVAPEITPEVAGMADETNEFFQAAAEGRPAEELQVETVVSESRVELAAVETQIEREQRKLQAAAVARIAAAMRALHFRKIALPFLFGMAIILGMIAGATQRMASTAEPEAIESNPLLANSDIFVVICLTMAGVMLIGGSFFAYEIFRLKTFIRKAQEV